MPIIKDDLFNFRSVRLPMLTPDLRDRCLASIEDAKELRDKDLEATLRDLLNTCDRAEAALRVTYRTLTRYRNNMPNLMNKLRRAKEENK